MEPPLGDPILFDCQKGEERCKLVGHKAVREYWNHIESGAFSPDGRIVATGGHDGTVRLWATATGEALHVLTGHENYVRFIAFSGDGKTLMSRTGDGMTRIWDVANGNERNKYGTLIKDSQNLSENLSPDGKYLAVKYGDTFIRVYEAATGKPLRTIPVLNNRFRSFCFSHDGKTLAYGQMRWGPKTGPEDIVCLWEMETGKERGVLTGHLGCISELAFSPNDRFLASGSGDTTTLIWDLAAAVQPNGTKSTFLDPKRLEHFWAELASDDAHKAYQALWALIDNPKNSIPFLARVMKPAPPPNAALIQRKPTNWTKVQSATREHAEADTPRNQVEPALPLLRQHRPARLQPKFAGECNS